ncbi:MAG: hypothetical protein CHACPFDD_00813 [Phycisphaerae bacterium]|nr:hypothetical protein [Phycisphaerae bacterium]
MNRRFWLYGVVVPVVGVAFAGFASLSLAQEKKAEGAKPAAEVKDVVDTAMGCADHKTLCKLLTQAELVETLKGKGPFTIFAPTDAAFQKLGQATIDDWMKSENKAKLQGVLKYHVVAGKHTAADVAKMKTIKTMNGEATITTKDGKTLIDNAHITKTDVLCSNGVIHFIDTVNMPKHTKPE